MAKIMMEVNTGWKKGSVEETKELKKMIAELENKRIGAASFEKRNDATEITKGGELVDYLQIILDLMSSDGAEVLTTLVLSWIKSKKAKEVTFKLTDGTVIITKDSDTALELAEKLMKLTKKNDSDRDSKK